MKSKFLTEQDLLFDPEEQSFLFAKNAVDEIAGRFANYIKEENYEFEGGGEYSYPMEWDQSQKEKMLRTQITMFLPTLNDMLEEYFSMRKTCLGTSLNALNFMFCFTEFFHYTRPFGRNFINLLEAHGERVGFAGIEAENRIIEQDLEKFGKLYDTFNLKSVAESRFTLPPFWSEILKIYITDVIYAVENHDVFKILGNITDTEVALGQNDAELVEECFTFFKDYIGKELVITKFLEEERLPGKFSDSYMAVSNRNHLLSPDNPEHVAEIHRIIRDCKISEETLEKLNFSYDPNYTPSTVSLSDDDVDPAEISAGEESTYWRDTLTPSSSGTNKKGGF